MYTIRLPFFMRLPLQNIIWRLPQKHKTVYLTFDDGPIPEVTPWVLDLLEKEKIKATFFCIGDNVIKHPTIYNQVIEKGHSIGQHTFNHMPAFKNSKAAYKQNVLDAKEVIKTDLFRPPHGQIYFSQLFKMRKEYRVVLWDLLSGDFDQTITPQQCFMNVKKYVRNGSVIVFHDSLKAETNLQYTLPKTIEYLRAEGYQFGIL